MSASQLSAVLVNALADERFCQRLLTKPGEALTRFNLSPDEMAVLSNIHARSIEEYAAAMVNWLSGTQSTYPGNGTGATL